MEIAYTGDGVLLTIGTGPDHGMIDISINGWFWRSFNGYEERVGEKVIELPKVVKPDDAATGKVSIEVRSDNHHQSTGRVFRFKQIEVITVVSEDRHHVDAISYRYDGLNRLTQADGATDHTYAYDRSGNLTSKDGATRTYNAANQLTAIGNRNLTYDANGNLTSDGTNTYTWDRANRLTQVGNTTYTYDGLGNRVSQTVNTTKTDYLLDLQAGLPKVLAATTGTNTERYIHALRGLHATEDSNGTWTYALEDALGSVRGTIGSTHQFQSTHNYDPYGHPTTAAMTGFAFTGEPRDANGLQYHRARYYNPALAIFPSLDPFEGTIGRPMSLNGYSYVEGNTPNRTDPTGMCSKTQPDCTGLIGNPLAFWACINGIAWPPKPNPTPPTRTPTATPTPCDMRAQNGINVLAATAIAETDAGGSLSQNNEAVAALMLMQVNSFRAGSWRQLGTFAKQNKTPETIIADTRQTQIMEIANLMVEGYCQSGNALSQFNGGNYPEVANSQALAQIAGNTNARFEISIAASRAEQFRSDPAYPLQFVVTAPGADRAIVVGDGNITNAWLRYQCPAGEVEIMRENPSSMSTPYTIGDKEGEKFECRPCRLSHYWWQNPATGGYEKITSKRRSDENLSGYGATCE